MANETHTEQPVRSSTAFISPEALLEHWQGHRRLTHSLIEAFPEEAFFQYSVGGMRPFAALAQEMVVMAGPGMQGIAEGTWPPLTEDSFKVKAQTKAEFLQLWDETTEQINTYFPKIAPERFPETITVFGMYTGTLYWSILYFIDNEIHHRGQAYVYLRILGLEPPPFWQR